MPWGNLYAPGGTSAGQLDSANIIAEFRIGLQAGNEAIWAPRISVQVPSSREIEEFAWLGQVPIPRQWVGGRHEEVLQKYSMTLRNFPYEVTLPISEDDLRRDATGNLLQRANQLGQRFQTQWNSLLGTFITNGHTATSGLAYDAQFFFDVDHNESGTNQSNNVTVTEIPGADVATPATPTTTEAANIITQAIAYMMGMTDDKGEPINQNPTEVLILTTKPGHYAAFKNAITLNNLGTGSGNNNPVQAWSEFTIRVLYVPQRLTAVDVVYFFFGNPEMGDTPFIRTEEQGVRTLVKGRGSDDHFNNKRFVFGADAVRGVAYGVWQKALRVTLS